MQHRDTTSNFSANPLGDHQKSVLRVVTGGLLLGSLAFGCNACSDTVDSRDWSYGEQTEEDATNPTPGPDTGIDTGPSPDDTSVDPTDPDTDGTDDRDTGGPDSVSTEGWHHSRFEKSLFARSATVETRESDTGCRVSVRADGEAWWMSGGQNVALTEFYRAATPRRFVAKLRATGEITPRGEYGHLGGYDRQFEPEDLEILACETSKKLGSCVVPREQDRCVHGTPDGENTSPAVYRLTTGSQTRGPQTMTHYGLQVVWRDSDGSRTRTVGVDFSVAWTPIEEEPEGETDWFHTYDVQGRDAKVDGLKVVEPDDSTGSSTVGESSTYGDVDGWIRLLDNPNDTPQPRFKLSLEGTASDGSTVHVWGTFRTSGPGATDWRDW